jgi:hypothetical protein
MQIEMRNSRLQLMRRPPKWAEWMAEKPGKGHPWPRYHRWFWLRFVPWEARFWLVFAGLLALLAIVSLVLVLLEAA